MAGWDDIHKAGAFEKSKPLPEVVEFIHLLEKEHSVRILDLGCGTGRHVEYLQSMGFEAYGCDISEEALKKAKEKCPKCKFEKCDMKALPYENGFFDAVISNNLIQHGLVREIRKTISEIYRVLKTGGFVLITTASTEHYNYGKGTKLEEGTFVGFKNMIDGDVPHHFFTEKEMREEFGKFKVLKLEHLKRESEGGEGYISGVWILTAKK